MCFLLLLELCLISKEANNNWNNIFHILYSIFDVRPIKSFSGWGEICREFWTLFHVAGTIENPAKGQQLQVERIVKLLTVPKELIVLRARWMKLQLLQSHKISSVLRKEKRRKNLSGEGELSIISFVQVFLSRERWWRQRNLCTSIDMWIYIVCSSNCGVVELHWNASGINLFHL